jgi:hypothetical protein
MLYEVNWSIIFMLVGIANNVPVDWDNIQIVETNWRGRKMLVISEEQIFVVLGFKVEEERAKKRKRSHN